jgi:hypothetical protein
MVCRPLRRFADGVGAVRPLVDGVEGSGGARWAVNPARLSASAPDANRGTVLAQAYTSGIDARLSRVSTLGFNSPNGTRYPLAAYRRAGMDLFAVVDYPAVDIQLDRTYSQKPGAPPTASAARTAGPRRPRASIRASTASGASSRNRGSTA